jgi:drug/metabolite transporter (DMT)-like permease
VDADIAAEGAGLTQLAINEAGAKDGLSQTHRPLAVAAIVAATCLTNLQDTLIKGISGSYPFHEMQSVRCGVAVIALSIYAAVVRGGVWLPKTLLVPVVLRGAALALASALYYLCASGMPLPGAVALYFTMPLMVAVLAGPLLGEHVPLTRWLVIGVGLAGILIMVRPGTDSFSPAAIFGIMAALCYTAGNLITRRIGPAITTLQIAFWSGVMYLAVALVLAAIFGTGAFEWRGSSSFAYLTGGWVMPRAADLAFFAVLGVSTAVLMGLYTVAYRLAEASFVAPFEYSAMFWAVLFGWVLLGGWPGNNLLAGAAVIIAAGLFLMWREGGHH